MAPDPVADKSSFLCMYMSGHPDTLVAYAKHYGKISRTLKGAKMTSISTKAMNLKCTFTNGTFEEISIPIEPPLRNYDDVKPRLLEMKSIAQEALGMIKTPQITSFTLPKAIIYTGLPALCHLYAVAPILFLIPSEYSWFFSFTNNFIRPFFGNNTLNMISIFLVSTHLLEAAYTTTLCRKHTSFIVGVQYVVANALFGIPIILSLRKKIQSARIDSVMKVE